MACTDMQQVKDEMLATVKASMTKLLDDNLRRHGCRQHGEDVRAVQQAPRRDGWHDE